MKTVPTRHRAWLTNYLIGLRDYSIDQLLGFIRNKRQPALLRVAALRWLIFRAPVDITGGSWYLNRRRAVRLHYGV